MKSKNNAKTLFMVLCALNVLLVGGIIGVFTFASGIAQQKSQKIADLKADQESNDQAIGNYKVLQASLNANKDLAAIAQKALPTDKDQSGALADLDQFSKKTGLPIEQITFNAGTNKGAGRTLTSPSSVKGVSVVSVVLHSKSANYDHLLAFLQQIENAQRRMQVSAISISPNSTDPSVLDNVDLTIDIYLKAS